MNQAYEKLLSYVEQLPAEETTDHKSILMILRELLEVLACDRAWCLYPCDPESDTWSIPAEVTRPEWAGVHKSGLKMPSREADADIIRKCLNSTTPITFGKNCDYPLPEHLGEFFMIRSQMATVIYPQQGQAWLFGVHYCEHHHAYTNEEREFFAALAKKMGEVFTSDALMESD